RNLLAQYGTVFFGVLPRLLLLAFVIAADAVGGGAQRLRLVGWDGSETLLQAVLTDRQRIHAGGSQAVERIGPVQYCRIAALLDVVENFLDAGGNAAVRQGLPGKRGTQPVLKISCSGIQAFYAD